MTVHAAAEVSVDFDVLVAGAGGAGCAAALAGAQGGCTVLLADAKEPFRRGCNTWMSTSTIPAGGGQRLRHLRHRDAPAHRPA